MAGCGAQVFAGPLGGAALRSSPGSRGTCRLFEIGHVQKPAAVRTLSLGPGGAALRRGWSSLQGLSKRGSRSSFVALENEINLTPVWLKTC